MAKRRRLSGPNPDFLSAGTGLETKSMFPSDPEGAARRPAPPIADVAAEASVVAALDEVTGAMTEARKTGRLVLELSLNDIKLDYLVRDRIAVDDAEMEALVTSIRTRGQQTPIEVADLGDGRYGLISGWRRCHALQRLQQDTGEARFGTVLALLRRPEEASDAYLSMVEENEIRVGLSYYERARIAAKAVDQGVFETEKKALQTLFASASRAKRSKIGSFLTLVRQLEGTLRYPEAIGERLGLRMAKALDEDETLAARLQDSLARQSALDPAAEMTILDAALSQAQNKSLNGGVETESSAPPPRPDARPFGPGITLEARADGKLVLSGRGVDETFRQDLVAWLEARAD